MWGDAEKRAEWLKAALSAGIGVAATFGRQYGLMFLLVCFAVVLDFVTGIIKAKAAGDGLDSKIARRGFWRKIALLAALSFGIFLDLIAEVLLVRVGIEISSETPFALIVASYIVLNESISIAENLYLIDPGSVPAPIVRLLKVAKDKF